MSPIITQAKQTWGGFTAVIDDRITWIPNDPENADFQLLQTWIAAGGVAETASPTPWPLADSEHE